MVNSAFDECESDIKKQSATTVINNSIATSNKKAKFYRSWWILPLYLFFVVNSGSIFWGWAGGFQEMFYKMGAYSWIENPDSRSTNIGYLLTASNMANLISDAVVGNVLDFFGPRYTLLIGIVIRFGGWLFISFSSEELQFYLLGMILIGASTDLIYFPFCSYGTIYHKNRGLVVSLMGGAMSFSSIVPILIYQIWEQLFTSWSASLYLSIYAIGWFVMMLLCALLLFPVKSFTRTVGIENQNTELSYVNITSKEANSEASQRKQFSFKTFFISLAEWFKPALRPSYLIIIPVACFLILRSEYIQRNIKKDIPLTYDVWVIISPLRFIPCSVMGEISDRFGHIQALYGFEVIAAILLTANFFRGWFPDIVATICTFIFTSWIMTSQYVYISKTQPSKEFGRLCGIIAIIAGGFLSFNILIAPYTETTHGKNVVNGCMLALCAVNALILSSIYIFKIRVDWNYIKPKKPFRRARQ